jgi:hypothetical protein
VKRLKSNQGAEKETRKYDITKNMERQFQCSGLNGKYVHVLIPETCEGYLI